MRSYVQTSVKQSHLLFSGQLSARHQEDEHVWEMAQQEVLVQTGPCSLCCSWEQNKSARCHSTASPPWQLQALLLWYQWHHLDKTINWLQSERLRKVLIIFVVLLALNIVFTLTREYISCAHRQYYTILFTMGGFHDGPIICWLRIYLSVLNDFSW